MCDIILNVVKHLAPKFAAATLRARRFVLHVPPSLDCGPALTVCRRAHVFFSFGTWVVHAQVAVSAVEAVFTSQRRAFPIDTMHLSHGRCAGVLQTQLPVMCSRANTAPHHARVLMLGDQRGANS